MTTVKCVHASEVAYKDAHTCLFYLPIKISFPSINRGIISIISIDGVSHGAVRFIDTVQERDIIAEQTLATHSTPPPPPKM